MSKRVGSRFQLISKKTGKPLSKPTTKKKAQAQERAIQAAKHARGR